MLTAVKNNIYIFAFVLLCFKYESNLFLCIAFCSSLFFLGTLFLNYTFHDILPYHSIL